MKRNILLAVFILLTNICYSQNLANEKHIKDLTDEKYFKDLKSIKSYSHKKNKYSVTLNDNSFLSIEYIIITDGEYNATYNFDINRQRTANESEAEFNYSNVLNNLNKMTNVLRFSSNEIKKARELIVKSKAEFTKKEVIVNLPFLDYDEAYIYYKNQGGNISCIFFFRRLL